MKVMKKVLAIALAMTVVLSATGCAKKAKDKKTFKAAIEKCDYDDDDVREVDMDDKHIKKAYTFSDDGMHAQLIVYKDKDAAKDDFEDFYDDMKDLKDDGDFDGSVKKSGLFTKKITINGEYDTSYSDSEYYCVVILDGNILITVYTYDTGKSDVKDVKELVKALGY